MSSLRMMIDYEESVTPRDFQNVSSALNLSLNGTLDQESGGAADAQPPYNRQSLLLFLFIFYTVVMGPICIMGFVGNSVSILVLNKDRNNRVVTFLLKCLALADNLVLLVSFITLSVVYGLLHYLEGTDLVNTMKPYFVKYVHPVGYISQTLTIWLTVLLAINRYIAICRPFDVHKLCTLRMARIQVFTCLVVTLLLNLPRFFQYHIVTDRTGNTTVVKIKESRSIGESTLFGMIVTNGLFTVVVLVLPLILLLIVNTKLIRELQRMRQRINRTSHLLNPGDKQSGSDGERNITVVMVIIIVVLLVCHTPDRVAQLLRVTVSWEHRDFPTFIFIFTNVANLLIVLNSSTNFFIYYFLRQRFRMIFKAAFGCKPKPIFSDDEKGISLVVQSTPLTGQNVNGRHRVNDSGSKVLANGTGI